MTQPQADAIHARLRGHWPEVLALLGVGREFLKDKHGPCPACGGTDRYRFDDRQKRGDFYCNQCGAGDGFTLLMNVNNWTFKEALGAVIQAANIGERNGAVSPPRPKPPVGERDTPRVPTARVFNLLRSSTTPDMVPDAIAYLESRKLWPLPRGCKLRAHAMAEYWDSSVFVGTFPALVAPIHDIQGRLTSAHVTYLQDGKKLEGRTTRKILCPMGDRSGCAVRLMEPGPVLGVGEGLESCLAWHKTHKLPAWSCLNTALLAKFEPPAGVEHIHIIADKDVPGLIAAWRLRDRLGIDFTLSLPTLNDWAEDLERD